MPEALVDIGPGHDRIAVRMDGNDPTFRLASDAIRAAALTEPDDSVLDFLEIAATIFAADSSVKRGGATRPHMGENWRRSFRFRIPVRRPDIWSRPEVIDALASAAEFLTEDRMSFEFFAGDFEAPRAPYLDLDVTKTSFAADEVIMFSGGLDSFAGALETLSTTSSRIVLVSHRSAQKTIPRQVLLGKYLQERFGSRVLHVQVVARRSGQEASDATQRSRTLLFAALGKAVASIFGAARLSFFENGIVSHNLPLSQQIVGTMATRTTHPLALTKVNELLELVWPGQTRIANRYQWLTKTEVVRRVAEYGAEKLIPKAVSCTSIREQTNRHTHCGACSQCLDRRFAILAAGLERFDKEEDYKTDVLFGPREKILSRTMAIEWTRHALRLGRLDPGAAMAEFGLELSRVVAGHPEMSSTDSLNLTLDMNRRHSESVTSVLAAVAAKRAADIASHKLPPNSLIVMHLGQADSGPMDSGLRFGTLNVDAPAPWANDTSDMVPEPDNSLEVAFIKEGDTFVIAARGLGRVTGNPAMVAHGLKPAFDEDRAAGRAREDHRYLHARDVALCPNMTDVNFRQYVRRCRRDLAAFFEGLHGHEPGRDLLIESKPRSGYRLDPSTVLVSPERID